MSFVLFPVLSNNGLAERYKFMCTNLERKV